MFADQTLARQDANDQAGGDHPAAGPDEITVELLCTRLADLQHQLRMLAKERAVLEAQLTALEHRGE